MWLVVLKEGYYPSVYECKTEQEAKMIYEGIKLEQFYDTFEEKWDTDIEKKLYIAEVKEEYGTDSSDVHWSASERSKYVKYEF